MTQPRLTLTELLVAVLIIGLLILILVPVLAKIRVQRRRTACANNLPQIGKAMHWYCNDYDDKLPFAAGLDSRWGTTPNYQADTRPAAFGLDSKDTPGEASISASLYLLIKYEDLPPSSFLCKGDIGTTQFIPKEYGLRDKDLINLWDFGPDPSRHCSYSYHIPYGPYPLTLHQACPAWPSSPTETPGSMPHHIPPDHWAIWLLSTPTPPASRSRAPTQSRTKAPARTSCIWIVM